MKLRFLVMLLLVVLATATPPVSRAQSTLVPGTPAYEMALENIYAQLLFIQSWLADYLAKQTTIATSSTPSISAEIDYLASSTAVTVTETNGTVQSFVVRTTSESEVRDALLVRLNWTRSEITKRTTFIYKNANVAVAYEFAIDGARDMALFTTTASGNTVGRLVPRVAFDRLVTEEFYGSNTAYESTLDDIVVGIKRGERPAVLITLIADVFSITDPTFAEKVTFDVSDY